MRALSRFAPSHQVRPKSPGSAELEATDSNGSLLLLLAGSVFLLFQVQVNYLKRGHFPTKAHDIDVV